MKKNILIDGYYLTKPRGMGRYIKELIYSLSYTKAAEDFNIYVSITDEEFHDDILKVMEKFNVIKRKQLPFPIWEQAYIPYLVKQLKVDVLLSPYNTYPILTKIMNVKNVITIHDLMFLDGKGIGGNVYQKMGNVYRKSIVKSITNRTSIISVSKNTSDELYNKLNLHSKVIYTAIDYFFEQNKCVDSKKSLDDEYYYHVGGVSPHKNTERVIQAFCKLKSSNTKLVISGLPVNNKLKEKYKHNDKIIFTGWLEDIEVANLYKFAKGVIFPSLVEGYGLPIIEAFKYRTPVVTSNFAPMSEIAHSAAVLVDPYSITAIQQGMEKLDSKSLSEELVNKMDIALKEINSRVMGEEMKKVIKACITT